MKQVHIRVDDDLYNELSYYSIMMEQTMQLLRITLRIYERNSVRLVTDNLHLLICLPE